MVVADAIVLPCALWSALALRLGQWEIQPPIPWWLYALTVAVSLPIFLRMGLYRAVIRYFEVRAFKAVLTAAGVAAALFTCIALLTAPNALPAGAYVIYAILSASYAALTRLLARQLLRRETAQRDFVRVGVYGAGAAGRQMVQAMRQGSEYLPVVWIDDNPRLDGRTVMGMPIVSRDHFLAHADALDLGLVVVAIPSLSAGARSDLLRSLGNLRVEVRLLPGVAEMIHGETDAIEHREVRPEDLLGRDAVMLDQSALEGFLHGKVVMVTGAGGSIGSELCRQIVQYRPARLVLYEMSEFALYALREEFTTLWPAIELVCLTGDVKNPARVSYVMTHYRPSVVFHAAAYKHVPLMEQLNAWEAVRNNAYGSLVVGRAAVEAGVEKFVLVSTDKAVNPTNVMGATKRLAEMTCQALHSLGKTQFEMVRFGNVLGSSGSVIPKFRQQIAQKGPITVTHPDIVRYFMSIPEAAQLVLQSACMGCGGEVFVLDMGEPVRIVDLARNMIRLSGYTEEQIGIEFTGLRPGEKLFEELLADSESTRPTHHPKIRVARVQDAPVGWCAMLANWVETNPHVDDEAVRARLSKLVPEYKAWKE
jgi:FlaA1/EpsC-like NDP-sugar epimerase